MVAERHNRVRVPLNSWFHSRFIHTQVRSACELAIAGRLQAAGKPRVSKRKAEVLTEDVDHGAQIAPLESWLEHPGYYSSGELRLHTKCLSSKGRKHSYGFAGLTSKHLYVEGRVPWSDSSLFAIIQRVVERIGLDGSSWVIAKVEFTNHRTCKARHWHVDSDHDLINIMIPLVDIDPARGTWMRGDVHLAGMRGEVFMFNGRFEHCIAYTTRVRERSLVRVVLRRYDDVYRAGPEPEM